MGLGSESQARRRQGLPKTLPGDGAFVLRWRDFVAAYIETCGQKKCLDARPRALR